jgi:endoglycosylceramidase
MRSLLFFLVLLKLSLARIFRIDKSTKHFVDDKKRVNIFHGVNVVVKLPPFMPIVDKFDPFYSLSDEDIKYFKKFGFNLVRMGVIWESIERAPGVFDYDHLDRIEELINKLGNNGIHVIIDAHQDVFSRLFCGEGVPTFYAKELFYEKECKSNFLSRVMRIFGGCIPLKTFHWKYNDDGLPIIESCRGGFMKYYQSPELSTIYKSFYNNQNGIQDKFAEFWKVLAKKFKDHPHVIGYDLWNEPWPGNLWSDLRSFFPGHSDRSQVLPFYKKLDKEIRSVDDNFINMFESVPFPDTLPLGGGKTIGNFPETPAGEKYIDKQVLNLHSYCCQAGANVCEKGEPSLENSQTLCKKFHRTKLDAHNNNAKKLGVPLIITEFGACSNSDACYYEIAGFAQAAEEFMVSWAYWMYKPYGDHTTTAAEHTEGLFLDNGLPQENKIKALTRTYVQSYQGIPLFAKFDPETATFNSSFIYDEEIDAPTVIYYNREYFYPIGNVLSIKDENGENIEYSIELEEENYYSFKIKQKFSKKNPVINIKLTRQA